MKAFLIFIILALTAGFGKISAQHPIRFSDGKTDWHNIGEMAVDLARNQDEMITSTAEQLSAIKFRVMHGALYLKSLEIFYENGAKEEIKVNTTILDLNETNVIELNRVYKRLKKIIFHYQEIPNNKTAKAYIEVWGLKSNMDKI